MMKNIFLTPLCTLRLRRILFSVVGMTTLGLVPALFAAEPVYDSAIERTPEQTEALQAIHGKIPGFIVFESNRSGDWQLYRMNADGSDFKQLTDMKRNDQKEPLHATISPDGKTIAWEHREKGDSEQVWLMDSDGSNQRRLFDEEITEESGRPSFLPDGRLKLSRNGKSRKQHIVIYDWDKKEPEIGFFKKLMGEKAEMEPGVQTWEETLVLDFDEAEMEPKRIDVRDISPDLQHFVAFSKYPGQGTWRFSVDGTMQEKIQGGCSPRIMADGENFTWVMIAGTFGIGKLHGDLETQVLFNGPYPPVFQHGYFPYLSADYKYLVLSACPVGQHDHGSANYQVMIVEMDENLKPKGTATRLTFSNSTDRYPIIWTPDMYSATNVPEITGSAHEEVQGPGDFAMDD